MRVENTEANWRLRLGDRARQLVLGVMAEDQKPDGDLLEQALAHLDRKVMLANARSEALAEAHERLALALGNQQTRLEAVFDHNAMMLGIVYRQLFVCRQVIALIDVPHDDAGLVLAKTLEVLQTAEESYLRLIPEAERRYPAFDQARENAALAQMEAASRTKAERAKLPAKEEERER